MPTQYDRIGKTYTTTRAADPRISQRLISLLGLKEGRRIVDIGAGSGNYSWALANYGLNVEAVEPSIVMRDQATPHKNLRWHDATAEDLPFQDGELDGAIMTLSLHHMDNWQRGIREALRVSGGGPLVIFAFDIEHKSDFWLFDYFPEFVQIDETLSPTISELEFFVEQDLEVQFEQFAFPLPKDLIDHFAAADWAHPEAYLDDSIRNGISTFPKLSDGALEHGLNQLRKDLNDGEWKRKYGQLLELDEYDRGYLFVRIRKSVAC